MNTIPTTSKRLRISYTVVGGARNDPARRPPAPLSLLVLNRGGRLFNQPFFEELAALGVEEIVSVEGPAVSYRIEGLSRDFPRVKFLVLHDAASPGEQVNIGVEEAGGEFVFVIWNDIRIPRSAISQRLIERLRQQKLLCVVPLLQNPRLETVPTIMVPAFHAKRLKILALQPSADSMMSLFPFDYCGLYSRERFTVSGGYDSSMPNPYWQKLDFGFRSYMWGEKVLCNTSLRLGYTSEPPADDATPDESYKLFFLKNLCIRCGGDSGSLPFSRFFPYFPKAASLVGGLREFREARRWVAINRFRFKQDARGITDLWEVPEP